MVACRYQKPVADPGGGKPFVLDGDEPRPQAGRVKKALGVQRATHCSRRRSGELPTHWRDAAACPESASLINTGAFALTDVTPWTRQRTKSFEASKRKPDEKWPTWPASSPAPHPLKKMNSSRHSSLNSGWLTTAAKLPTRRACWSNQNGERQRSRHTGPQENVDDHIFTVQCTAQLRHLAHRTGSGA